MDWDEEDETVSTPTTPTPNPNFVEQNQPEKAKPEKEKLVSDATGQSPSYYASPHKLYARSRNYHHTPVSVFLTMEVLSELTESKIDGMVRENFAAILTTDDEAQTLPRFKHPVICPLTKGSDQSTQPTLVS